MLTAPQQHDEQQLQPMQEVHSPGAKRMTGLTVGERTSAAPAARWSTKDLDASFMLPLPILHFGARMGDHMQQQHAGLA